jgi:hypothetical protein
MSSDKKNPDKMPPPIVLSDGTVFRGFGPAVTTTNAPPPIKPMGNVATVRKQPTVAVVPNWREWSHMPKVEVWQACALSLNINPYWLKGRSSYQIEPGQGPCFSERSFPSAIAHNEFSLRKRLLIANLPDNEEWFDFYYPSAISISEVRLSEFATWAVSRMKWPDLPPELVALARKQPSAPEQNDAPAPVGNVAPARVVADSTATTKEAKLKQDSKESTSHITTHHVPASKRTNILDAVFQLAKDNAVKATDWQSVWASLVKLAEAKERPAPLLGFSDDEGVKYQDYSDVKFLSKKNFKQRWSRANPTR